MKITAADLIAHHACNEQVRRFKKRLPNGVRVSIKSARALAPVFDIDWVAGHFLTKRHHRVFDRQWFEYHGVYCQARNALWDSLEHYGDSKRRGWHYNRGVKKLRLVFLAKCAESAARLLLAQGYIMKPRP